MKGRACAHQQLPNAKVARRLEALSWLTGRDPVREQRAISGGQGVFR
jgi:hypothetical protein